MNIAIDIGNTSIKAGVFDQSFLLKKHTVTGLSELYSLLNEIQPENLIVSSVRNNGEEVLADHSINGAKLILNSKLSLPILNHYDTPETLGVDRIAAACGANMMFPKQNVLVIDAGTCINYEFINNKGEYKGGAISPGVQMRFEAMHHFTAKLPNATPTQNFPLTGSNTLTSLQSGVMNGVLEEIKGTIARYQSEYHDLRVILCGGDAHFFENHLNPTIFVAPDLVLMGLNSILLYNVTS
ncbi:MAG: type III pantothenate kinase [Cyclobacteriaceae bacterium]|nr:type III pantothenate kinase [Cyclobacteriaceae bacterium]